MALETELLVWGADWLLTAGVQIVTQSLALPSAL